MYVYVVMHTSLTLCMFDHKILVDDRCIVIKKPAPAMKRKTDMYIKGPLSSLLIEVWFQLRIHL